MKLSLQRVDLPLKHTFAISRESTCVVRSIVVRLEQDGNVGYGAAVESTFYNVTIEEVQECLLKAADMVEDYTLADPMAFWFYTAEMFGKNRFAQSALDIAAYDLWGKLRQQPVWKLWGYSLADVPQSSFTIGIDSIPVMVDRLKEFPDWPIYKIKLGTDEDIEIVTELRKHTDAIFRVDPNGAWGPEETVRNAELLKPLGVEFIEQPLPANDWEGMRFVNARSVLPIIADESCRGEKDVDRCAGVFDGINIKLGKCGGLTPARRMIKRAQKWGLKCMLGCMVESTIGISALAQLAPIADYADLDGPVLIDKKVADGVEVEKGKLIFPSENGCGLSLVKR